MLLCASHDGPHRLHGGTVVARVGEHIFQVQPALAHQLQCFSVVQWEGGGNSVEGGTRVEGLALPWSSLGDGVGPREMVVVVEVGAARREDSRGGVGLTRSKGSTRRSCPMFRENVDCGWYW